MSFDKRSNDRPDEEVDMEGVHHRERREGARQPIDPHKVKDLTYWIPCSCR
jgi:hypothetical protein